MICACYNFFDPNGSDQWTVSPRCVHSRHMHSLRTRIYVVQCSVVWKFVRDGIILDCKRQ